MLNAFLMRTTVTLDADVAVEIERLRREDGLGLSQALNQLARKGMALNQTRARFEQRTYSLGLKVDVTNIGEVLAMLDEA